MSRPQGHSAAGRTMLMKNHYPIVNRTRHLPACGAVPQPTATTRKGKALNFPNEGSSSPSANIENHRITSTPTLYGIGTQV